MKLQAQSVVMENVFTLKDGLYFLLEFVYRKGEKGSEDLMPHKNKIGYNIFLELVNPK